MCVDIVEAIRRLDRLRVLLPASPDAIEAAERSLGLSFAPDYSAYVRQYGAISACGIELTGVTTSSRLNVVSVTNKERPMNENIPSNMYVVEAVSREGLLILQDSKGTIYSVAPHGEPCKIFDSLTAYVNSVRNPHRT